MKKMIDSQRNQVIFWSDMMYCLCRSCDSRYKHLFFFRFSFFSVLRFFLLTCYTNKKNQKKEWKNNLTESCKTLQAFTMPFSMSSSLLLWEKWRDMCSNTKKNIFFKDILLAYSSIQFYDWWSGRLNWNVKMNNIMELFQLFFSHCFVFLLLLIKFSERREKNDFFLHE